MEFKTQTLEIVCRPEMNMMIWIMMMVMMFLNGFCHILKRKNLKKTYFYTFVRIFHKNHNNNNIL